MYASLVSALAAAQLFVRHDDITYAVDEHQQSADHDAGVGHLARRTQDDGRGLGLAEEFPGIVEEHAKERRVEDRDAEVQDADELGVLEFLLQKVDPEVRAVAHDEGACEEDHVGHAPLDHLVRPGQGNVDGGEADDDAEHQNDRDESQTADHNHLQNLRDDFVKLSQKLHGSPLLNQNGRQPCTQGRDKRTQQQDDNNTDHVRDNLF